MILVIALKILDAKLSFFTVKVNYHAYYAVALSFWLPKQLSRHNEIAFLKGIIHPFKEIHRALMFCTLQRHKACRELKAKISHWHINTAAINKWNIHSWIWTNQEPVIMLEFHFHHCPQISVPAGTWQLQLEGVLFQILENLCLLFCVWDVAEDFWCHKKGNLRGQMRGSWFVLKNDCKRQFTSDLKTFWLLIREEVTDEMAA